MYAYIFQSLGLSQLGSSLWFHMSNIQRGVQESEDGPDVDHGNLDVKFAPGCREFNLKLYHWQK
jgi:hypothetical protein